jgi:glycosyltransferase involved in cell wall biosynthesis
MSSPSVSVVIPVFNAGKHLAPAIGSIVDQTYRDWEMICVNDGSTDGSSEILDWFADQDSRIRIVHQSNAGVVAAANRGHALAKAEYVCRMDADDIAMPDRLSRQLDFMRNHRDYAAISGAILEIDSDSEPLGVQRLPADHETIVQRLLGRGTGLFQPASMMRASAFQKIGGFRTKYQWIEDHDLWLRMSQVGRLGNLDELVLCYRLHASSCTWSMSKLRAELMSQLIREAQLDRGIANDGNETMTPPARSFAGPGKWARKAGRGGYPRTAMKHLKRLWKEDGLSWYTLRMFMEVGLRLPIAASSFGIKPGIQIPDSDKWQRVAVPQK